MMIQHDDDEQPMVIDENLNFTFTSGTKKNISEFQGKPLLLTFWSINCPVCITEIPKISKLRKEFYPDLSEVIAVNIPQDPPPAIFQTIKKFNIDYPVALDVQGDISKAIGGIKATPFSLLLNKEGKIVYRAYGELNTQDLRTRIKAL